MAQYRARAKAGWEASAASRAEDGAKNSTGYGGSGQGTAGSLSAEGVQALAQKEGENQVQCRPLSSAGCPV